MTEEEKKNRKVAGERIVQMRRRRGMTQRELAGRLGIRQSAMSSYEHGHRDAVRILARVEAALGVEAASVEQTQDRLEVTLLAHYRALGPEDRKDLLMRIYELSLMEAIAAA